MTTLFSQRDLLPTGRAAPLVDRYGRHITYLRVSVTDRCDFRCVYCMAEDMTFLPKPDILTLEEIERLATAFIRAGVTKLRITGGEPLVRRGVITLIERLGQQLGSVEQGGGGLEELTLTTNGTNLARFAQPLARAGIKRINVSLDTLNPDRFARITRWGRIDRVFEGLAAAQDAGLAIKINTVALLGENEHELDAMVEWCGREKFDFCLIETMPMGEISADRGAQYLTLQTVRARLAQRWTLTPSNHATGGPARYETVAETGQRIGFITPLSHNFCESCNRVRLTVTGTLFMCLGQDDAADLRAPLRAGADDTTLDAAIREAISRKPRGHDFAIGRRKPAVARHMSVTGG